MILEYVLIAISIFIFGILISWFVSKTQYDKRYEALANEANIKITSLQNLMDSKQAHYCNNEDLLRAEKITALSSMEKSNGTLLNEKNIRIEELQGDNRNIKEESKDFQENTMIDKALISQLQTTLKEQTQSMQEKIQLLQNNEEHLKIQFKNLATQILDSNSKKFSQQNKESMDLILNPMKQQINDFKKKVEDVYVHDVKDRSELRNELKTLKELNQQISTDAINLTNALKGQSKQQGVWGEMVLEKVLESSGLRKDEEYVREKQLLNDDGEKYRPDVIVNLPENRNIIIDAKTSLSAYEQYASSENEQEKETFLNNHLISINKHISELSDKKYEELKGVNTLDFIFMFVPIESALMLAMQNDKDLFDRAFKKKIVLVSPTTLLVALKAIESSWRYEKQARNITEVYDRALKLYEKIEGFVSTLETVGKHIKQADEKYEKAFLQLSTGSGNILRQVAMLKEVSQIKPKKEISSDLIDTVMLNDDNECIKAQ
jgi:DNA recombination protein RmuC